MCPHHHSFTALLPQQGDESRTLRDRPDVEIHDLGPSKGLWVPELDLCCHCISRFRFDCSWMFGERFGNWSDLQCDVITRRSSLVLACFSLATEDKYW